MRNLLLVLAVLSMAAPAMARDNVHWSTAPGTPTAQRADVVLEYDGWELIGFGYYGMSPNWTDYTAVNFETPSGGPYCLAEAQYYVFGPGAMPADVWSVTDLFQPPVATIGTGITFTPVAAAWPPAAFSVGNVSGYGIVLNSGDLFAVGTDFALYAQMSGIGLADAYGDGNPGHSWAIYAGAWTDDTYGYSFDDGIRAGLNQGISPVKMTTWGGVKALYR
jgi:hypothetical protein